MIPAKLVNGLFLIYESISTGAVLSGADTQQAFFAFRARQALTMGAISLTLTGGNWTANDVAYWNIGANKNGAGSGSKTLQTIGAGGTGSIAANGTVQLFAPGFQTCAAGDVWIITFSPIGGPADLPVAAISFDLSPG